MSACIKCGRAFASVGRPNLSGICTSCQRGSAAIMREARAIVAGVRGNARAEHMAERRASDERYRQSCQRAASPAPDVYEPEIWTRPEVRALVARADSLSVDAKAAVLRYRQNATVREIAAEMHVPWPRIHMLIFDLRRAGVALPRRAA